MRIYKYELVPSKTFHTCVEMPTIGTRIGNNRA